MRLTVLGSTAGAPSRTNPSSGYLIENDDVTIWMDAGVGTFMRLAELVDPGTLDAVIISHTHVDHCSDIFGLYSYLAYGPSGRVPVKVYAPEGAAEHLAAFARASPGHIFNHVLDFEEVLPGDTVNVGDVSASFGVAVHPVPALVTRVESGSASLVYSGDTGPGGDLIELATGSNLLLCEATMVGVRDEKTYKYHLTAAEAGEIATRSGVDQLILTHIDVRVEPQQSIDEAASTFTGSVEYAAPERVFEIEVGSRSEN